jgi:hypothetical protein
MLRNILKDPTFDPTRDADVSRLLSAIKIGAKGRTYGNESEQLEAAIRYCVIADDLRSFLISEDEARYRFYNSDDAKKLVGETLPLRKNPTTIVGRGEKDLRNKEQDRAH